MAPSVQKITGTGRPLLDKSKPVARRGRKATGQTTGLIAGPPKEGVAITLRDRWSSSRGRRPHPCPTGGGSWLPGWPWLESSLRQILPRPACSTQAGPLPPRTPMEPHSPISRPIASTTGPRLRRARAEPSLRSHPPPRPRRRVKRSARGSLVSPRASPTPSQSSLWIWGAARAGARPGRPAPRQSISP